MTAAACEAFVLAVYPTTRGFSFVLFEGPESPYDWGVKVLRRRRKNAHCLAEVRRIIERYQPYALVLEDVGEKDARRGSRVRHLLWAIAHLAQSEHLDVYRFTKATVHNTFRRSGATTKYEIAQAIAIHLPAFAHRLPPIRKAWMSEDPRMNLFDAAALGLTYFATRPERGELPGT